jgi:hypothetical protein
VGNTKNDKEQSQFDCQLQVLYDASEKLSLLDRLRNISLRLMSALRRRLLKVRITLGPWSGQRPDLGVTEKTQESSKSLSSLKENGKDSMEKGDLVEILPIEYIKKTLDNNGSCQGLVFMRPMEKYCGRRARILKKVRTIYDERLQKMVKIRNVYLLENVICDGRDFFSKEGCDRSCFFFWKENWLRRIEE